MKPKKNLGIPETSPGLKFLAFTKPGQAIQAQKPPEPPTDEQIEKLIADWKKILGKEEEEKASAFKFTAFPTTQSCLHTIRTKPGYWATDKEIDDLIEALAKIASGDMHPDRS